LDRLRGFKKTARQRAQQDNIVSVLCTASAACRAPVSDRAGNGLPTVVRTVRINVMPVFDNSLLTVRGSGPGAESTDGCRLLLFKSLQRKAYCGYI